MSELKAIVEALIFASPEPVTMKDSRSCSTPSRKEKSSRPSRR
jgi:chromosome segregation and condensation protein ScpB